MRRSDSLLLRFEGALLIPISSGRDITNSIRVILEATLQEGIQAAFKQDLSPAATDKDTRKEHLADYLA